MVPAKGLAGWSKNSGHMGLPAHDLKIFKRSPAERADARKKQADVF